MGIPLFNLGVTLGNGVVEDLVDIRCATEEISGKPLWLGIEEQGEERGQAIDTPKLAVKCGNSEEEGNGG